MTELSIEARVKTLKAQAAPSLTTSSAEVPIESNTPNLPPHLRGIAPVIASKAAPSHEDLPTITNTSVFSHPLERFTYMNTETDQMQNERSRNTTKPAVYVNGIKRDPTNSSSPTASANHPRNTLTDYVTKSKESSADIAHGVSEPTTQGNHNESNDDVNKDSFSDTANVVLNAIDDIEATGYLSVETMVYLNRLREEVTAKARGEAGPARFLPAKTHRDPARLLKEHLTLPSSSGKADTRTWTDEQKKTKSVISHPDVTGGYNDTAQSSPIIAKPVAKNTPSSQPKNPEVAQATKSPAKAKAAANEDRKNMLYFDSWGAQEARDVPGNHPPPIQISS